MQQLILDTNLRKDKKVFRSSQSEFTKGKSCLTNLITFHSELASLLDEWRGCVYLGFSRAFNTVFYNILIDKLTKYGLNKWTLR